MSDKTKRTMQEAEIARRFMEQSRRRPEPAQLLCACGAFASWADHGPLGRMTLYCDPCARRAGIVP